LPPSTLSRKKNTPLKHCYWTLVTDEGNPQKIGLLHGEKTGHLLIYCNKKILSVDFKVRDSKVYSFFVNDELCEIHLIQKGEKMFYEFKINKEADTPRNRVRKKMEKKYWGQTLLFFGGMLILLVGFLMGMKYYTSNNIEQNLEATLVSKGIETVGTVMFDGSLNDSKISYLYIAENISHSSKLNPEHLAKKVSKPFIPLSSGDEFLVEYAPSNPKLSKIFFDKPTQKQINLYYDRVVKQHQRLNPTLATSLAKCQVKIAFELKGVNGLADFYHQKSSPENNPKNNQNTYLKLIRDLPFQKKVENECWE
jgi:hypothetical protein